MGSLELILVLQKGQIDSMPRAQTVQHWCPQPKARSFGRS
jgi:hypothetical protein